MQPPEAFRYIGYLRLRWRFVAASCLTALAIATALSLVLPREYTATARIIIEPPAGADPRSAMAVSPIYLESLKTYEQFADSDSLFQKAATQLQLRALLGDRPIESLKKKVLKVGLLHNTRILEIEATLPDPGRAQKLAQFLAEESVSLNRSLTNAGGQDLLQSIQQQEADARARVDQAEAEWSRLVSNEPVDDLQAAVLQAGELRSSLERQAASANLELAEAGNSGTDQQTRLSELRKQLDAIERQTAEKEKLLAGRLARRERIEAERRAAQAALLASDTRLRDARSDVAYRGERLSIIDSGVVPERPSSPNLSLNLAAALLLGLLFPLVYLALEMNYHQHRVLQALARDE
jgi:capsule polysaccharide export protein KpsE/RkpR